MTISLQRLEELTIKVFEEEAAFRESIKDLPLDKQEEAILKKKAFETDERRHRELCAAIRASSFWNIGCF